MSLKDKLQANVNVEVKEEKKTNNTDLVFKISKKIEDKTNKKTFNLTLDNELTLELDKIAKKTKRSRNEVINLMLEWCVGNVEIE